MPVYSTSVNADDDLILQQYGKLLKSQGFINHTTRYSVTKYIIESALTMLKEKLRDLNDQLEEAELEESPLDGSINKPIKEE